MTNLSKPVVVFDMDDTLCLFIDRVVEVILEKFGLSIDPVELHVKWQNVFVNETHSQEFLKHIYTEEFYMNLKPRFNMKHVETLLSNWSDVYDFQIITHRGDPLGDRAPTVTRAWLDTYEVGKYFSDIQACSHKLPKSALLPANTVAIFDDSLKVRLDIRNNSKVNFFMVSNPWNIPPHWDGGSLGSLEEMDHMLFKMDKWSPMDRKWTPLCK